MPKFWNFPAALLGRLARRGYFIPRRPRHRDCAGKCALHPGIIEPGSAAADILAMPASNQSPNQCPINGRFGDAGRLAGTAAAACAPGTTQMAVLAAGAQKRSNTITIPGNPGAGQFRHRGNRETARVGTVSKRLTVAAGRNIPNARSEHPAPKGRCGHLIEAQNRWMREHASSSSSSPVA